MFKKVFLGVSFACLFFVNSNIFSMQDNSDVVVSVVPVVKSQSKIISCIKFVPKAIAKGCSITSKVIRVSTAVAIIGGIAWYLKHVGPTMAHECFSKDFEGCLSLALPTVAVIGLGAGIGVAVDKLCKYSFDMIAKSINNDPKEK